MRLWLLLLAVSLTAQTLTRKNISSILDFENSTADRFPTGWGGSTAPAVIADASTANTGRLSARIERTATDTGFTTITTSIPYDFTARTIEYKGFIKTENVRDAVAMWIRIDGPAGSIGFATLQPQAINGTRDWRQYSLTLQGNLEGRQLVFGFLLVGPGKAWVDSLELFVDGKPIAEAPDRQPTVLETDSEFSGGSRISIEQLSNIQTANLASLGLVWGFVKYHHPAVTSGKRHWDFDLFRVMPAVLAAENTEAAATAIADWIDALGPVPQCTNCTTLRDTNLQLAPPSMDWTQSFGDRLSGQLENIHRNRSMTPQFFVELFPGVGNPNVEREPYYASIRFPDSGYQLLGLFRFWNLMQYFNPNRDIMGDDPDDTDYWNRTLAESIGPFAFAKTRVEYQQAFLKLIARVQDTHANLWSGTSARPPMGACLMPVDIRFVEGQPIVYRNIARPGTPAGPLQVGDILTSIEDLAIEKLLEAWRPYYPASNEPTRLRDIGNNMTRGACGPVNIRVDRDGVSTSLAAARVAVNTIDTSRTFVHDRPGPAFQKPAEDIAYIKISDARAAEAGRYFESAAGTAGVIIDLRNYPSDFPIFQIGGRLVSETTPFVRFTRADLGNPGAFHFRDSAALQPLAPHYKGKIVILIDEITQSSAEYHAMAFRTAPGAVVLGSTTAGADGNVSTIPLPGNERSLISGIGVFYPDERPTQRIGIVPDIELKPTIVGIREGRDELVEAAIRIIRGMTP